MSVNRLLSSFPRGSSFALVGNSGNVLGARAGLQIDRQDCVVRFNLPKVAGFEEDVGSRTDILFCNAFQDPTTTHLLRDLSPKIIVCLLGQRESQEVLTNFENWSCGFEVWQTFAPDLAGWTSNRSPLPLMTGTYGLAILNRLFAPREIFLTGFSFFKGHSHRDHYWETQTQPSAQYHDLHKEAEVFAELLRNSNAKIEGIKVPRSSTEKWSAKLGRRLAWCLISSGLSLRRLSDPK